MVVPGLLISPIIRAVIVMAAMEGEYAGAAKVKGNTAHEAPLVSVYGSSCNSLFFGLILLYFCSPSVSWRPTPQSSDPRCTEGSPQLKLQLTQGIPEKPWVNPIGAPELEISKEVNSVSSYPSYRGQVQLNRQREKEKKQD